MALIALRMALPKGLKDVPLHKLFEFRERHREELTAYQRFVSDLLLLTATVLAVYKPRGVTPYGWRRQQERRKLRGRQLESL
jgi:hypothetical protein